MNEYVQQAKDFLKDCNATMEIKYAGLAIPNWDTQQHATYHCLIETPKGEMGVLFYASLVDAQKGKFPTEYDILSCLSTYEVGDLEDFMFEFGYEIKQRGDLKRIQDTYNAVVREYQDVCRCFTEEQIEALNEIV